MTAYGPPAVPRPPASPAQRAALMSYVAGGLGLLCFVWGFLKWVSAGEGDGALKYGGYALGSPAVAIVGFSLAAGLLAATAAWEKKPATLTPVALAVAALLLAFGVLIGKGSISAGGRSEHTGIAIGLILALITILIQVGVLVFAWMAANGRMPARPAAQAWSAQPAQQSYPVAPTQQSYPVAPTQLSYPVSPAQSAYGPPQPHDPAQLPPPVPPGYGSGPGTLGYGPPPGQ